MTTKTTKTTTTSTAALCNPLVTATAFKQDMNDTLGIVVCDDGQDGSLIVSEVATDSPMEQGLPVGSKIVAINHVQPLTAEHAMQLILEQPPDEEVIVVALKPTPNYSASELEERRISQAQQLQQLQPHSTRTTTLEQQDAFSSSSVLLSAFLPLLESNWPQRFTHSRHHHPRRRRPLAENQAQRTKVREVTVTCTVQHRVGLELQQKVPKKKKKNDNTEERMIVIETIDEKSPFFQSELQVGMELISINGWMVKGQVFEHVVRFLQGTPKDTPVTIVARTTTKSTNKPSRKPKPNNMDNDQTVENATAEGKVDHDDDYLDNENEKVDNEETETKQDVDAPPEIPRVIVTHYPVHEGKEEEDLEHDHDEKDKKQSADAKTTHTTTCSRVISVCKLVENPQQDGAGVFFRTEQNLLRIGAISTVSPFYKTDLQPGQIVLAINGNNAMEWTPYNALHFLRKCPEGLITFQTYRLMLGKDGMIVPPEDRQHEELIKKIQSKDSQDRNEQYDDEEEDEEESGDIAALAQVNLCTLLFGVPNKNKNALHNAIDFSDSLP